MDKLYNTQMELAQQISVEHTRKILGGRLGIVFYDVTTLYFEISVTDALREPGFSKDGRMAESQVVPGLLVSEEEQPQARRGTTPQCLQQRPSDQGERQL